MRQLTNLLLQGLSSGLACGFGFSRTAAISADLRVLGGGAEALRLHHVPLGRESRKQWSSSKLEVGLWQLYGGGLGFLPLEFRALRLRSLETS